MNNQNLSILEHELLEGLHTGDPAAFGEIYLKHHAPLCHFAGKLLDDPDGGQDIVDDVFLKLWERSLSFNDSEHLKAFLYHSIRNACLDQLRSSKRRTLRDGIYAESALIPTESYLASITHTEVITELYQAISNLPGQAQKIIRKTFMEGKSNEEVAEEMKLSIHTVKNQKRRGLDILRGKLSGEGYKLLLSLSGLS